MALVLTADANPGTASWVATAGSIFAAGKVTMTQQTENVVIAGVLATDIVIASMESDDTGASIVGVNGAKPSAGSVAFKSTSFPGGAAGDGVFSYIVVRPG